VINFLAFLGWNPGTEEEMFSLSELESSFEIGKIIKSGAKFNYEKAKWYNQQYIISSSNETLAALIQEDIEKIGGVSVDKEFLTTFCGMMKERVMTLKEFSKEGKYFFTDDFEYDVKTIKKKFKIENGPHFEKICNSLESLNTWKSNDIQNVIKSYITDNELSFGAILPILRICLAGTMKGPDVFQMMELLGRQIVLSRMEKGLKFCKMTIS